MFGEGFVKTLFSIVVVYSLVYSLVCSNAFVRAQDLIPTDDFSGGASIFVFRSSRKKPQAKLSAGKSFTISRLDKSIPSPRRRAGAAAKRAANAKRAATRRREAQTLMAKNRQARRKAANKIKLSDQLTAKAETLLENRQLDQAVETFRAALVQNPKNADAKFGLSEALTEKGINIAAAGEKANEAAMPFFNEAIAANAANAAAYRHLGEIHAAHERKTRAVENYEKALQLNPALTELYAVVGLLLLDAGEIANAGSYVEKGERARLEDAPTFYLRGLYFYKQNRNSEALAALQKSVALDPGNVLANYYQALVYDRLKQNQQSIAAYQRTVEIEPAFAPGWFDLGAAYYNAERYDEASAAYQKTIALDPENAEQAHANLASVYRQQERYPEANGEYKLAAEKIKDDPDLFSEWGFCLGKTKEWSKAVERLTAAKDLTADAVDYTNLGWGFYNAARVAEAGKNQAAADAQYAQGKTALEKAVELNPRLPAAQYNLGTTLNALKDYQTAIGALTQAVGLKENWVLAINELGVSHRRLKNYDTAVREFKRAINLDSKFAPALYNLGELEFARGNKKEAKRIQAGLKQINPELGQKLDDVITGRIVDETKRKIIQKIPKIPRIPF